MNKYYYITGPDGSGKTTFIKQIEEYLTNQNKKTKHIWIRSPKIFSKPLMAYCRLIGLTKYTIVNGVKYGKHEFYKSKFISWFFPILQLLDFKFKWLLIKRKINPHEIILFDRFVLDTLADLMVDTNNFNLHKSKIGRKFINSIPKDINLIVLETNEEYIRSRKIDTLHDEHLTKKINVYKLLANDLNLTVINNNKGIRDVKENIFKALGI